MAGPQDAPSTEDDGRMVPMLPASSPIEAGGATGLWCANGEGRLGVWWAASVRPAPGPAGRETVATAGGRTVREREPKASRPADDPALDRVGWLCPTASRQVP